jgi:superfamily II DNA helicase RecQ
LTLLVGDDIVKEFKSLSTAPSCSRKVRPSVNRTAVNAQADEPLAAATPETEQLAARLRKWRTAEAKRLGVPAYVVLHDRSLSAVALTRPANPAQLVAIAGIGPAKAEKFGAAILQLCAAETGLPRT